MYHRELLMLYFPWRHEERDLNTDPLSKYVLHNEAIKAKAEEYNPWVNNIDLEDVLEQDYAKEDKFSEFESRDAENNGVGPTDQNLFDDISDSTQRRFLLPGLFPQPEYENLMESLNTKQKNYVLHIVHAIKANSWGKSWSIWEVEQGLEKAPLFEQLSKALHATTCLNLEEDQTFSVYFYVLRLG